MASSYYVYEQKSCFTICFSLLTDALTKAAQMSYSMMVIKVNKTFSTWRYLHSRTRCHLVLLFTGIWTGRFSTLFLTTVYLLYKIFVYYYRSSIIFTIFFLIIFLPSSNSTVTCSAVPRESLLTSHHKDTSLHLKRAKRKRIKQWKEISSW